MIQRYLLVAARSIKNNLSRPAVRRKMRMLNEGGKNSPAETTSSIGTPMSWAMNPSTENTTKPAKILVALFRQHSAKQSLQHTDNKKPALSRRRRRGTLNVLRAGTRTCSSYCCICCSSPERSALPGTRRRRRTPESQRRARPGSGLEIDSWDVDISK